MMTMETLEADDYDELWGVASDVPPSSIPAAEQLENDALLQLKIPSADADAVVDAANSSSSKKRSASPESDSQAAAKNSSDSVEGGGPVCKKKKKRKSTYTVRKVRGFASVWLLWRAFVQGYLLM